jgi:hypothetical protein
MNILQFLFIVCDAILILTIFDKLYIHYNFKLLLKLLLIIYNKKKKIIIKSFKKEINKKMCRNNIEFKI